MAMTDRGPEIFVGRSPNQVDKLEWQIAYLQAVRYRMRLLDRCIIDQVLDDRRRITASKFSPANGAR